MKKSNTYLYFYSPLHAQKQGVKIDIANRRLISPLQVVVLDFHTYPYCVHVPHVWQKGSDEVWNTHTRTIVSFFTRALKMHWRRTIKSLRQTDRLINQRLWRWAFLTLLHLIRYSDQRSSHWLTFIFGILIWHGLHTLHQCVALLTRHNHLKQSVQPPRTQYEIFCTFFSGFFLIAAEIKHLDGLPRNLFWNMLRDRTLFLKDRDPFPQGCPPGWGSRGFTSTDVMLCFSHTKEKRCWQLRSVSAIKHKTANACCYVKMKKGQF